MQVDPELEHEVLALVEADTAGLEPGSHEYRTVSVTAAGLRELTGWSPETARGWLEDEIDMAKGMAGHWVAFLDGDIEPSGLPPVIVVNEHGTETIDGMHRLAGYVVHGVEPVELVLGTRPGLDSGDALAVEGGWDAAGSAPSPRG